MLHPKGPLISVKNPANALDGLDINRITPPIKRPTIIDITEGIIASINLLSLVFIGHLVTLNSRHV